MKKIMRYAWLLTFALGAFASLGAQVNVVLGESSFTNGVDQAPSPYGTHDKNFRQQYLYRVREIQDAGGGAGNISALAFKNAGLYTCPEMRNFRLRLRHTDQTELSEDFEQGNYQEVFLSYRYIPLPGWNVHTFSSPFVWNGSQNILVDIVTDICPDPFGMNASVYYTPTSYHSALRFGDGFYSAMEATTGVLSYNRANIRFNMAGFPPDVPPCAAQQIFPPDGASLIRLITTFSWLSGGGGTRGYRLNFGTDNPPSNIEENLEMGSATSYTPTSPLALDTTYFWQILSYNSAGMVTNSPIWSFTTHGDTTIEQLPYIQTWDGAQAPDLPIGWTVLRSSMSSEATIQTSDSNPYSPPNSVMISSGSTSPGLLLVSPQISPLIPINSIRIKVWLKMFHSDYLQVGVISDPADISSFEAVQNIYIANSQYREYEIPLLTYTGAGRHIAFRQQNALPYRTIFMDDLTLEEIDADDLAATAIRGNLRPSVHAASYYSVDILNYGSAEQSNYTVKLIDSNNLELSTAFGNAILPGETQTLNIPWTPSQEGEMSIHARVVLPQDTNAANDETPPLNANVCPEGSYFISVGAGNTNYKVPWDFRYPGSFYQLLYHFDEIGSFGKITALSFYNNFDVPVLAAPIQIWLGSSSAEDLFSGLLDPGQLTLVYDGTVDFPSGENIITIELSEPYSYTENNLVLYTRNFMDTSINSWNNYFKCQRTPTVQARYVSGGEPMAPNGVESSSLYTPKISLYMEALSDEASYVVSPLAHDFGDVSINETAHQDFSISNAGGQALQISSITIAGGPAFTLVDMPDIPASINTGGRLAFGVNYSPSSLGEHSAQISITDNLSRVLHTIDICASAYDATIYSLPFMQNWDTVTAPDFPLGWSAIKLSDETYYASINTSTDSPYSAPNCVKMWNNHNTSAQLYLISPLIGDAIDISKIRIGAMMKHSGALRTQVGTMVDPTNPHSFELAGTFTIVGDWTYDMWSEYTMDLTHHTGVGRYLAFRSDPTVNGFSMCMDDLVFEEIVANDLAAISLRGERTCPLGLATDYTVTIYNNGFATQAGFQVQLVNATGHACSFATGGHVAAGETVDVRLSYIPSTAGYVELRGKVILSGDNNSVNNKTPPLRILVRPENMFSATIADGEEQINAPWDFEHTSSLYQALYYRSEIGSFGKIYGISFYNNFEAEIPDTPIQLWLGSTYQGDLNAGWIDPSTLTLVYDGLMHFPGGENSITIPLIRPYHYASGHLVLYAHRPRDLQYYRPNYYFEGQSLETNRVRSIFRDHMFLNPMQPPIYETELSGSFPKTTFLMICTEVGSLSGMISATGAPLPNVELRIDDSDLMTISSISGAYSFPYLLQGEHTLFAHKDGYEDKEAAFTIVEDENTSLDLNMIASIPISVSGTIVGRENPVVGLDNARIILHGPVDYTAYTDASGEFILEDIPSGNSYDYTILRSGYRTKNGHITVGSSDFAMPAIILVENPYLPRNVVAEMNDAYTTVLLQWEAPDPDALSSAYDFLEGRGRLSAPADSCADRSLLVYEIYRIRAGEEDNEDNWTLLDIVLNDTLVYEDIEWFNNIGGICRWGVKAIYTDGVSSTCAFSNLLVGPCTGRIRGFVWGYGGQPIPGARVSVANTSASTTTNANGSFAFELFMGVYSVHVYANGYYWDSVDNVEVFPLQDTILDIYPQEVANQNEVNLVTATALKGNYPNPFNPTTTIHYDILQPCTVRLDVYNIKGQKVRSLLNEAKNSGRHSIVFEANDDSGKALSSGVYFYRLTAGKYNATRKMLLME